MAIDGKTIGQLDEIITLSGNEEIPVQVNGENKKIKTSLFATQKELGDINVILDKINGEVI